MKGRQKDKEKEKQRDKEKGRERDVSKKVEKDNLQVRCEGGWGKKVFTFVKVDLRLDIIPSHNFSKMGVVKFGTCKYTDF